MATAMLAVQALYRRRSAAPTTIPASRGLGGARVRVDDGLDVSDAIPAMTTSWIPCRPPGFIRPFMARDTVVICVIGAAAMSWSTTTGNSFPLVCRASPQRRPAGHRDRSVGEIYVDGLNDPGQAEMISASGPDRGNQPLLERAYRRTGRRPGCA